VRKVVRKKAALAALVLTLLAGGCGIPDNTDVRTLRPGPSTGVLPGADASTPQPKREDSSDPGQFLKNYLSAAAGDFDSAADRVKDYLSPTERATFKPQADTIKVVRLAEEPLVNPGSTEVSLRVREVGTLGQSGILNPSSDDRDIHYKFGIDYVAGGGTGLFITKAPLFLLLSDTALDRYYTPRTIYFWNQDHTGLIPDLRYLERSVPTEQIPTQIVDWLTSGPSPWLDGVAEALPEGAKLRGNVPAISNETMQISLNGQALPPDDQVAALDRLQKQLRWSLRPYAPTTLELTIERAVDQRYTDTNYLGANAAYRQIYEPERFVVYDGQIRRLSRSYNASRAVPIVRPEDNKNVRTASIAVAGARGYAALVVNESGGPSLRVGASGADEFATLRRIPLPGSLGRPVWAKSGVGADSGTSGLIPAAGRLYSFTPDGKSYTEVQWQGGRPGPVTWVAVAPDAHRAAILAGGRLYVAALSRTEDGMQLSSPHVIRTQLRSPTSVDWSSEQVMVVAGLRTDNNRVAIMEVSVDGGLQTFRQQDLGVNPVKYLTAMPASPSASPVETTGAVAYVQRGAAYDDEDRSPIGVQDLAVPVANPQPGIVPGVPFFLS